MTITSTTPSTQLIRQRAAPATGVARLEVPPGPGPFTPADAARVGLGRSALERMVREGRIVRLVRGVYLDATRPCPRSVRAEALAMAVGPDRVVSGLTAAWLLGADRRTLTWAANVGGGVGRGVGGGMVPMEVRRKRDRPLRPDEIVRVGCIQTTSPVQTAIDVGRRLDLDRAVAVTDALLHCRALTHPALLEGARRATGPGSVNARVVAARSEGRAAGAAESVLRLRWTDARLPTPIPGFSYGGVRLALALPTHRFAVVLAGSLTERQQVALRARGWRVVVLRAGQVLAVEDQVLRTHLEREFHQHLLEEVG